MPDPILQSKLPDGQAEAAQSSLSAMRPVAGPWLTYDEAYAAQMKVRRDLLERRERAVYAQQQQGLAGARAFLAMILDILPSGFTVKGGQVTCPDGMLVTLEWDAPLWTAGNLLQQDVCILQKRSDVHVLTGAVLCFPTSWTLAQKIGKPLIETGDSDAEYNQTIAAPLQRTFNEVQEDRPMWRANLMRCNDPVLHQPCCEEDPRHTARADAPYLRSEQQTVVRLPHPDAVALVIHTSVVRAGSED